MNPSLKSLLTIILFALLMVAGTVMICGAQSLNEDMLYPPPNAKRIVAPIVSTIPDSSSFVGFHYEYTYATYVNCNKDTNEVKRRMLGMFNGVRKEYAKAHIRVYISSYKIWTIPDPYIMFNSSSTKLVAFSQRMDTANIQSDLFQLLDYGCSGCGGIAYVNTLLYGALYRCSYSQVLDGYWSNGLAFPLAWNIYAPCHELGHNFGLPHTHDMAWNGDNTMYDSCGCMVVGCAAGNYVGGGLPAIPSNGGTLMSYCLQVNGVGVNGMKGFGSQAAAILQINTEAAAQANVLHNPNGLPLGTMQIQDVITTANSAAAEWMVFGATKYKYRVKVGTTWGSISPVQSSNTANITGLQSGTIYYIQVKSFYGGLWQSGWSLPYRFRTK